MALVSFVIRKTKIKIRGWQGKPRLRARQKIKTWGGQILFAQVKNALGLSCTAYKATRMPRRASVDLSKIIREACMDGTLELITYYGCGWGVFWTQKIGTNIF